MEPTMSEADLTTCPYCAETIRAAARKCKHCGDILDQFLLEATERASRSTQDEWNPGVAAVLSLVLPGAGPMYKGNVVEGMLWLPAASRSLVAV